MKGILLAGGSAKRLYPVTRAVCKQLLPVYDKPMIYYPLSVLLLAGIREILVISRPEDSDRFRGLLGDGSDLGVKIEYAVQPQAEGIAQSFIIAEDFIGKENVCLILGDNIFYGDKLTEFMQEASRLKEGAVIFGYYVKDPQRYGVIDFDEKFKVISIEEKPKSPKSNWVVTGLYFYDNRVVEIAKRLRPSARGELEITDINNQYLESGKLECRLLSRGYAWLDTGTPDSLIDASAFIRTIEERQGLKIGCIEEIAYRAGYIGRAELKRVSEKTNEAYAQYLKRVYEGE